MQRELLEYSLAPRKFFQHIVMTRAVVAFLSTQSWRLEPTPPEPRECRRPRRRNTISHVPLAIPCSSFVSRAARTHMFGTPMSWSRASGLGTFFERPMALGLA